MVGSGIVGRDGPLADLRRAVDDAVVGRGRLGLILGEAGIGKTALASEVADYATGKGAGLLWATCWDGDGAPAFWPWVQVLREYEAVSGQRLPGGPDAVKLSRFMSASAGPPGGSSLSAASAGERERFGLFDAVASRLTAAARVRPLLVVLDDLQWADVPSLMLLSFVAGQLATAPLLVVGALRDDEVGDDGARRELLARVRRQADVSVLSGLDAEDVRRLMGSVAGTLPTDGVAAEVSRRTGGNPFLVREVTQLLVSRGGVAVAAGGVPDGVRQVVDQRLARLSQACVSILAVAAVAGQWSSGDLLGTVTGLGIDALAEQLAAAVRSRVLVAPSSPVEPYRFIHDLFREAVYAELTPTGRAGLHLRVARALQQLSSSGSGISAAEVSHHLLLAAVGGAVSAGLVEESVRFGVLAAREAIELLAYEDAVAHVGRQIDGLSQAGILGDLDRLTLLLCRAEALRCVGDTSASRADFRDAADIGRRLAQPIELGKAALGLQALGVESGGSRTAGVDLLEEALDGLPDTDSAVKARVLAALARELFLSAISERIRAVRLCSVAVEMARRLGDDATLAVCLLASHDTIWQPGTAGQRRTIAGEMRTIAHRARDTAFEAEAVLLHTTAGLELVDPAALVGWDEFVRLGVSVGQPHFHYLVLTRQAARATMTGRFAEAEILIAEAVELAAAIAEPDRFNVQTRLLWRLRSVQARRAEMAGQLRPSHSPQLRFWVDAWLGLALLERGGPADAAEAVRAIRSAVRARPEHGAFSSVLLAQWAELGEAAAAAGLYADTLRYYELMLPYAGTTVVTGAAVSFDGAVDYYLGIFAAALDRPDHAVGHFTDAETIHERLSAWPWLARTQCELAAVLARRDGPADRDRLTGLIDQVRQAATEFGLADLLRRADQIALPPVNVFRRDGDGWHLCYAGQEVRLRDVKGLADIAILLAAPGRAVPAGSLATGVDEPAAGIFGADAVLDRQARQQYRARLAALDAEIDEAHTQHDLGRAAVLADEREFLVRELAAAVGLGQRERRLGDDRERARKAVTARIKDALTRITVVHPALGAHLRAAISTGNLCTYRPTHPTRWQS